jgi:glucose-1-phosphate adenylyltransferase
MDNPRILAIVLAGGEGTRLRPLTEKEAKPALPFGDDRRIVDFVLSNLFNSGIRSIYVLAQYKPRSLIVHVEQAWAGRLAAGGGFIETMLPEETPGAGNSFAGTADAVYRCRSLIQERAPDVVAVFAADHVYRMDVRQMAEFHLATGAEVSVAAVPVPLSRASSFGIIAVDEHARVLEFEEKPARPKVIPTDSARAYASMGNYLFDPPTLVASLEQGAQRGHTDFGRHLMPILARRGRTFAYDFSTNWIPGLLPWEERAYWRDVGTIDAYRDALRDVAGGWPRLELHKPEWPIYGIRPRLAAAPGSRRVAQPQHRSPDRREPVSGHVNPR